MNKCQWRCDHCDRLYDEYKCRESCNLPAAPAQSEPVAWRHRWTGNHGAGWQYQASGAHTDKLRLGIPDILEPDIHRENWEALYAAPPAQTAVTPTDEQIVKLPESTACITPGCHQWDGTDTCPCQQKDALSLIGRMAVALPVLRMMLIKEGLSGIDIADELIADARALLTTSPAQTEMINIVPPINFKSPLTPYGMLVRAFRIVANTTLFDMAKHLSFTPAALSSVEFGRKPLTDAMVADTAAYFSSLGIHDTLHALNVAALVAALSPNGEVD